MALLNTYKPIVLFLILLIALGFPEAISNGIGLFLIITIGLMHGCADLQILTKSKTETKYKVLYVIAYVLLSVLAILFYIKFPIVLIVVFGILSCYHFGEQHWFAYTKKRNVKFYCLCFLSGLNILSILLTVNYNETNAVLTEFFELSFQFNTYLIVTILSTMLHGFFVLNSNTNFYNNISITLYDIICSFLLLLIFISSNLILGFASYFVFFHSIPSIEFQIKEIYGHISYKAIKQYLMATLPVWIISVIGSFLVFFWMRTSISGYGYFLFGFLIAIASSHAILFHNFNKFTE